MSLALVLGYDQDGTYVKVMLKGLAFSESHKTHYMVYVMACGYTLHLIVHGQLDTHCRCTCT